MKVYQGIPGDPPVVTVKRGNGKPKVLGKDVPVAWGTPLIPSTNLAILLLADALGSQDLATKYGSRYKHRIVVNWKANQPWTTSDEAIKAVVADIEKVERETAQTRTMVRQEPKPVAFEGGADIQWTKTAPIKPNLEKKP